MKLKDLSDLLGLSQTTVSRALNGYPEVSEKTRRRVADAARANKYSPSQNARGLATGKAGAIGHIIPLGKHRMINPHFSDFIAGAGQTYAKLGLDIVMSIADQENELKTYTRLARSKRVDGFILQGPLVDDPRLEALNELDVPFVVHGRISEDHGADYSWLDVNNIDAFDRATQYLLDLGHRDIALLNGLEHMNFAAFRRAGFEAAMARSGAEIHAGFMFSQDMSEHYGYEATMVLLTRSGPKPTAILTSSKLIASGCQRAIAELGLTIGRDISVLTFDDNFGFFGTHAVVPNITCVRSSLFDAGVRVAEMIAQRIENPDQPPHHELWEAELIVGKSTGPI